MALAPKIILHCPLSDTEALEPFVEQCLRDGVCLIAVVGEGCQRIEDTIDEIIVGDGSEDRRGESPFLVTSSHPDEQIDEVLEFLASWRCETGDGVEQVRL